MFKKTAIFIYIIFGLLVVTEAMQQSKCNELIISPKQPKKLIIILHGYNSNADDQL